MNLLRAPMLPHPTQNARNLRLQRNFPAIFKQVGWMDLDASAPWVEKGTGGYESSAQEARASGATFLQQSLQLSCQGSQHLRRGTHVSKTPMSEPSLPQGGTQSGGGRDMGDRRGSMWLGLPKSVASSISNRGAVSRWGVPGQSLPLSLLCHAGNSLKANSSQGDCPLPERGRPAGVPRVSSLLLGQDSQPRTPTHHLG